MENAPKSLLQVDHFFCFQLYAASRALTGMYRPLLEPLGLTYPQYLVMVVLWEKESLNVKQLGEKLFLDSGTLTPLLKKLEGQGLVMRQRSATDERQVIIGLTPQGRALRESAESIPATLLCQLNLSEGEAGQFHQTIRTFLSGLHAQLTS
ncbi:MAG: MarR family transcriptional regulator [Cytophagales bacterium]|nr:MarR family transcriptional regulator [Cytophagales bacterium]